MTAIEDRITAVLRAHLKPSAYNHLLSISKYGGGVYTVEDIAAAVVAALGLQLTTGGQYATFGLQLSDEELDQAGFTYHRKESK